MLPYRWSRFNFWTHFFLSRLHKTFFARLHFVFRLQRESGKRDSELHLLPWQLCFSYCQVWSVSLYTTGSTSHTTRHTMRSREQIFKHTSNDRDGTDLGFIAFEKKTNMTTRRGGGGGFGGGVSDVLGYPRFGSSYNHSRDLYSRQLSRHMICCLVKAKQLNPPPQLRRHPMRPQGHVLYFT